MLASLFGSDPKINEVETSQLKVRGKTLIFNNTIYSIPNISSVSVGEMKRQPPVWGYLLILLGLFLLASEAPEIGLICLGLGGALIYWFFENKKHGLRLATNSGEATIIVSKDLEFLKQVSMALYTLMNSETERNVNFNLDQRQIVQVDSVDGSQFVFGNVQGDLVQSV